MTGKLKKNCNFLIVLFFLSLYLLFPEYRKQIIVFGTQVILFAFKWSLMFNAFQNIDRQFTSTPVPVERQQRLSDRTRNIPAATPNEILAGVRNTPVFSPIHEPPSFARTDSQILREQLLHSIEPDPRDIFRDRLHDQISSGDFSDFSDFSQSLNLSNTASHEYETIPSHRTSIFSDSSINEYIDHLQLEQEHLLRHQQQLQGVDSSDNSVFGSFQQATPRHTPPPRIIVHHADGYIPPVGLN